MLKNLLLSSMLIGTFALHGSDTKGTRAEALLAITARSIESDLHHIQNLTYPMKGNCNLIYVFNKNLLVSPGRPVTEVEMGQQLENVTELLKILNIVTWKEESNKKVKVKIIEFRNLLKARNFTFPSNMDRPSQNDIELFKQYQQRILTYALTPTIIPSTATASATSAISILASHTHNKESDLTGGVFKLMQSEEKFKELLEHYRINGEHKTKARVNDDNFPCPRCRCAIV